MAFRIGILSRIMVSPELGSLGLILEKVSDGVGVDGVGEKFPFLSGFCCFPVAED